MIDFGSSARVSTGPFNTFYGTVDFCAPEVLEGQPFIGKPQDMWALGILLYTLYYHEIPFCNVDDILSTEKIQLDKDMDRGAAELIHSLLNRDLGQRWTIEQVLAHPWVN